MRLDDFTVNCFNEHSIYFYLLILEDENINIYESPNEELIISQSSDIKYQILEVHEMVRDKSGLRFKINLPNDKMGYFVPLKSILLIPKIKQQVKVANHINLKNDLNEHLKIDLEYFENNRNKIVYSDQYVIFNDKIFEPLILLDEIIGFIEPEHINRMHPIKSQFKIIEDTTVYKNSGMDNPFKKLPNSLRSYQMEYIMPGLGILRFKYNNSSLWIETKYTDFNDTINEKSFANNDELLIYSMLYQYRLQLENYHKYYNKILKKK